MKICFLFVLLILLPVFVNIFSSFYILLNSGIYVSQSDNQIVFNAQNPVSKLPQLNFTISKFLKVPGVYPWHDETEIVDNWAVKLVVARQNWGNLVDLVGVLHDLVVLGLGYHLVKRYAQIHAVFVIWSLLRWEPLKQLVQALLHLLPIVQIGGFPLGTVLVLVLLLHVIVLSVDHLGLFALHLFLEEALLALAHEFVHLSIQVVIRTLEVVLVTRSLCLHLLEHSVDFIVESELLDGWVALFSS